MFIRRRIGCFIMLVALAITACQPITAPAPQPATALPCELTPFHAPAPPVASYPPDLPATLTLPRPGEPGERLVISGTIYAEDCRTPLAGALLEVWQANATGTYTYLEGKLRTDAQGRYAINTIKPGMYGGPAHIHLRVYHPTAQAIETELLFADDPRAAGIFGVSMITPTLVASGEEPYLEVIFDLVLQTAPSLAPAIPQVPTQTARPTTHGEQIAGPDGTGAINVQGAPQQVAAGEGFVWVMNAPHPNGNRPPRPNDGMLLRLDPAGRGAPVYKLQGQGDGGLAVGEGAVWITDAETRSLTRLAVQTGKATVHQPFAPGAQPRLVAVGAGFVWVTYGMTTGEEAVAQIDPYAVKVIKAIPVSLAGDVAFGGDFVWVANAEKQTVTRIDPHTGAMVGEPIEVDRVASGLEFGEGSLWVLDWTVSDSLVRLDPASGQVIGTPIASGADPFEVAVGEGSVWITNRLPGTVTRIDARSGTRVGKPLSVGDSLKGIAVYAGAVWVASTGTGMLIRLKP